MKPLTCQILLPLNCFKPSMWFGYTSIIPGLLLSVPVEKIFFNLVINANKVGHLLAMMVIMMKTLADFYSVLISPRFCGYSLAVSCWQWS